MSPEAAQASGCVVPGLRHSPRALGALAGVVALAPTEGSSAVGSLWKGMCVCHHRTCHDTEIIRVNQTFHRSGESRLWEEPQQKGMEAAEGSGSVCGC